MLEYLYVFPIAIIISALAMTFGIGGAAFFTPFFLLVAGLPPPIAAGAAIIVEVFGFSSGMFGFVRKKLIDYKVGLTVLCFTAPAAILGVILGRYVADFILVILLAGLFLVIAILMAHPDKRAPLLDAHELYEQWSGQGNHVAKNPGEVRTFAVIGGLLAGMVSSGAGEINDYVFLKKYRMPGAIAAGTSVFVLAWTGLVASTGHVYLLLTSDMVFLPKVLQMVLFAIPGVIIGAQIGVSCASAINERLRQKLLSALFFALAILTIMHVWI